MNPAALKAQIESALGSHFASPFGVRDKPVPSLLPTGIGEVDALAGGLPRGAITEIVGPPSSGRTTLFLSVLAQATARQEACALVDTNDAFDPAAAEAAGVELRRLLWVRCAADKKQALRVADLLLQGGGFGLVTLDLADIAPRDARRIPLSTWYRYRRAIEHTPTCFVIVGQQAYAAASAAAVLETKNCGLRIADCGLRKPPHAALFHSLSIEVAQKKPVRSTTACFRAKAL